MRNKINSFFTKRLQELHSALLEIKEEKEANVQVGIAGNWISCDHNYLKKLCIQDQKKLNLILQEKIK